MSVLIKGIEMPENCDKCRFQSELRLYCDAMPYNFCGNTDDIERPDWCPLVEIKTPHGRLIDAEKLLIDHGLKLTEEFAPTVIEAEGREE
jgi:hypothetical protein